VSWVAYLLVFVVAHAVGDFVFQTDFQAVNKHDGLTRNSTAQKALFGHLATYSLPFIGAGLWIGGHRPVGLTAIVVVLILLEHLVQDDGRLLVAYCKRVKGLDIIAVPGVGVWVDQSFHLLALFGAGLLLTL
jgi:hypothetical protein